MQERLFLPEEVLAQAPLDLEVADALLPALQAAGAQAPGPLADLWARAKLGAARLAALRAAAAASARLAAAAAAATGSVRDSVLQQSAWRHARPQVRLLYLEAEVPRMPWRKELVAACDLGAGCEMQLWSVRLSSHSSVQQCCFLGA